MPYHCVAYGCGKTAEDGVTLFKFPKDPEEFHKWEKQVQRTRSQWLATPNSHLCSEHFGKEYFEPKTPTGPLKLRPGAAPTVFVRPHCSSCNGVGCSKCLPAIQRRSIAAEPRERNITVSSYCWENYIICTENERKPSNNQNQSLSEKFPLLICTLHRQNMMKGHPYSSIIQMLGVRMNIHQEEGRSRGKNEVRCKSGDERTSIECTKCSLCKNSIFLFTVVCEMCGTAGTTSTFFSKTKRFCSISCSRSYSSNSKKTSILARLQVRECPHVYISTF